MARKAAPSTGEKQVSRDNRGRFTKGNKSGGRPKIPDDIKEMCKALTPKAIETAKTIMLDEEAKDADRLRAAEIILDRGYGKPAQSVNVETNDLPRFVFVGADNVKP